MDVNDMNVLEEISTALQKGKAKAVEQLCEQAVTEGISAADILEKGLMPGMDIIGAKFAKNEVYVPEVLIAARAMNAGTKVLKPYMAQQGVEPKGKACIGTVKGDLHDIGKNLVRMMLEGKGIEVIDLGTDVSPEIFIKTAEEQKCDIICCSALLTTTMVNMKAIVDEAVKAGIRDKVKIMIGGAPITQAFCDEIGADAYTSDAATAANKALEFINEKK